MASAAWAELQTWAKLKAGKALAVALQVVLTGEGFMAERTLKGPHPAVQGQVVLQVIGVQEAGGAAGAGVRPLARVLPHVDLQLIVPVKETGHTQVWSQIHTTCSNSCVENSSPQPKG